MKLTGKRALITGGTKGIGAAIALDLARGGADIAINGRQADGSVDALVAEIEALDRRCSFISGSLASQDGVEQCVDQAARTLGGLDILVHSAGGPAPGRIEDVSVQQWHEAFDVHVHAAFLLCRKALPWLRKKSEGSIILVSSAAGLRGCPGAIAYGTVKGAILQFTRMLARDLADDNIRVNCVNPGIIRTRFHQAMTPEQQKHNLANRIPLHREGTVDDVAQVVRMLITNDFVTGESVTVDGGMTMQIVR